MPGQFLDGQLKGIVRMAVKDLNTGNVLVLPTAAGGTFDPGVEFATVEESDCEGITFVSKRYVSKRDSKVTLQVPKIPDTMAMRLGKKMGLASATDSTEYTVDHFTVPANGLVTGVSSGYAGFGIIENAIATAAFNNDDGITEPLVQDTNYSSFNEASVGNAKKFAVGANGAMKFGTATRGRKVTVTVSYPTSAYYGLTTDLVSLSLKIECVDLLLRRQAYIFPSVSIEPGAIDFKEPQQELSFFVTGTYDFRVYQQLSLCRDKVA